jgi:hypothetical protein
MLFLTGLNIEIINIFLSRALEKFIFGTLSFTQIFTQDGSPI